MTSRIRILGAAGHGREVAAVVHLLRDRGTFSVDSVEFLDDDPSLVGRTIDGTPVMGRLADAADGEQLILGVGYPETKRRIVQYCEGIAPRAMWPVVQHPDSSLGPNVVLGRGSLLQACAVVTTNVALGAFSTVNIGAP